MSKKTFSFIGTGNMARAIINGMAGVTERSQICLYDKNTAQYDNFESGYVIAPTIADAFAFADYVVFAVKPQNFTDVLAELKEAGVDTEGKTAVTIAAGISTDFICRGLGREIACIRVMPNTPALLGKGVTALSRNARVSDEAFDEIFSLFSRLGHAFVLDESMMNDIIAVNSSSPAYVFLFVKAMYDTALEMGFPKEGLIDILCGVLTGSAEMLQKTGKTPDELIAMVKSPKGTTEWALNKLEETGFEKSIHDAMFACSQRARELSAGK